MMAKMSLMFSVNLVCLCIAYEIESWLDQPGGSYIARQKM